MADLRTLQRWLIPFAEALVELARREGWNPRVTSVYRSRRKQRLQYRRFLRGETAYTVAPPGHSMHERRIAFDMTVEPHKKGGQMDARLKQLGQVWRSWGGTWGGSFRPPDPVHFDAR